jgi:DNA-binding Lrp family transcriptional regulator
VPRGSAPLASPGLSEEDKRLAARLVPGLPLVPRPYAGFGVSEQALLATLGRWLETGVVRRIGAVLRHRRFGYEANAMVVWNVPDAEVGAAGRRLAAEPVVTLCYRRARAAPDWPYNLYCMVHGRERSRVVYEVKRMNMALELDRYPRLVLFSRRCFTQRAAQYG